MLSILHRLPFFLGQQNNRTFLLVRHDCARSLVKPARNRNAPDLQTGGSLDHQLCSGKVLLRHRLDLHRERHSSHQIMVRQLGVDRVLGHTQQQFIWTFHNINLLHELSHVAFHAAVIHKSILCRRNAAGVKPPRRYRHRDGAKPAAAAASTAQYLCRFRSLARNTSRTLNHKLHVHCSGCGVDAELCAVRNTERRVCPITIPVDCFRPQHTFDTVCFQTFRLKLVGHHGSKSRNIGCHRHLAAMYARCKPC